MDALACTVTVYSSRHGVNVVLSGTCADGCGNHRFAPARGKVADYIRRCVACTIEQESEIGAEVARRAASSLRAVALISEFQPIASYAGPNGRGIRWARNGYTLCVREDYRERGMYTVSVCIPRQGAGTG